MAISMATANVRGMQKKTTAIAPKYWDEGASVVSTFTRSLTVSVNRQQFVSPLSTVSAFLLWHLEHHFVQCI